MVSATARTGCLALCLFTLLQAVSTQKSVSSDCYVPDSSNGRIIIPAEDLPNATFQGAGSSPWSLQLDTTSSPSRQYILYEGPNRYDSFVPKDYRLVYRFYCQQGERRPVFLQSSRDENGGQDHESNDAFISMNSGDFVKILTRFENKYNQWVYSDDLELNFRPDQFLEDDEFVPAEMVCRSGINTVTITGRSNGYRIDFIVVGEPGVHKQDLRSRLVSSRSEPCPGSIPPSTTLEEMTKEPIPAPMPENAKPTTKPTTKPSPKPSSKPSTIPSSRPSTRPTTRPTTRPSTNPETPTSPSGPPSTTSEGPSRNPEPVSEGAACMPASSTVLLEDGSTKQMDGLRLGDLVQVAEGRFEPVFFFSHRDASASNRFISIQTSENKTISLSSEHLLPVYLGSSRSMLPAKLVSEDTVLLSSSYEPLQVISIDFVVKNGLYHPHTPSGQIVVDHVMNSCYTTAVPVHVADAFLWPQKFWFQYFGTTLPGFRGLEKTEWWGRVLLNPFTT